ncbi:acylphosphatase [Oxalobacteraceae bacterium R-40]|uniref:acylphosphatase n=1 Tax=Keguizhuia sedimenti TaxID=3064264 RepID=A0ABU1BSN4_9BURK|nr:acylphosphatase [Oxalobacteraceae bacterium R-40]
MSDIPGARTKTPIMTKHLRIAGRVQGVGYRAGFASKAQKLGLSGWVRNRLDGTVEALVQGSANELEAIIAWTRQGPGLARVDQVLVDDVPDSAFESAGFKVLPTE